MGSKFGARHGLPGYDSFRTRLTYRDVWEMLRDDSEDRANWKYKTRGVVLGHWHQLKMEMYERSRSGKPDMTEEEILQILVG